MSFYILEKPAELLAVMETVKDGSGYAAIDFEFETEYRHDGTTFEIPLQFGLVDSDGNSTVAYYNPGFKFPSNRVSEMTGLTNKFLRENASHNNNIVISKSIINLLNKYSCVFVFGERDFSLLDRLEKKSGVKVECHVYDVSEIATFRDNGKNKKTGLAALSSIFSKGESRVAEHNALSDALSLLNVVNAMKKFYSEFDFNFKCVSDFVDEELFIDQEDDLISRLEFERRNTPSTYNSSVWDLI